MEKVWENFTLLLIFSSLLCLINSHFLITKCLNLYVLCKEKLAVDNLLVCGRALKEAGNSREWRHFHPKVFYTKFKTIKVEYFKKYCVECCQLLNRKTIRQRFCYKLRYLALTSFKAISSLLSYTPINQNGGNSNFKVIWNKKYYTNIKNVFAEMLKLVW